MGLNDYLVISDLQMPFEAHDALAFCLHLKNHFKIPDENVLNVGDEFDWITASRFPKNPNVALTGGIEIKIVREKVKEWSKSFPLMKIATSNHGMRWMRKAVAAEIPSEVIRETREIVHAPDGWQWKDQWIIEAKHRFRVHHGMEWGGKTPYRQAAELSPMSTVFGHLSTSAGIAHVNGPGGKRIWGMNVGCLIDMEALAFEYGKWHKFKETLGAGVIVNNGAMPIWIPLE